MQTFLPYPSFGRSAACLDRLRLGKQRLECIQILRTLLGESYGWTNHPAVKMWRGCERRLAHYGGVICVEWSVRGYSDNCLDRLLDLTKRYNLKYRSDCYPNWFDDEEFHRSHQSNLLRKDPEWYGQFGWNVPNDLPYVWPIRGVQSIKTLALKD